MRPHQYLHRKRELEEAERQRQLERYYEEQERWRMMQQRQREEELRQRRRLEAERRHQMEIQKMRRLQQQNLQEQECYNRAAHTSTTPTIVRGPDGQLFQLVPCTRRDESHKEEPKKSLPVSEASSGKRLDDDVQIHALAGDSLFKNQSNVSSELSNDAINGFGEAKRNEACNHTKFSEQKSDEYQKKKSSKPRRRRVTITVEDASDSEYEDEYSSVWRNRRPSSGEWMEPVNCIDAF